MLHSDLSTQSRRLLKNQKKVFPLWLAGEKPLLRRTCDKCSQCQELMSLMGKANMAHSGTCGGLCRPESVLSSVSPFNRVQIIMLLCFAHRTRLISFCGEPLGTSVALSPRAQLPSHSCAVLANAGTPSRRKETFNVCRLNDQ